MEQYLIFSTDLTKNIIQYFSAQRKGSLCLQYDIEGEEYPFWSASESSLVSYASHRWPSKERNALEMVQDFPDECLPWCISSLEVHPHGWCTLARYTCKKSRNEWTVLHDIQDVADMRDG